MKLSSFFFLFLFFLFLTIKPEFLSFLTPAIHLHRSSQAMTYEQSDKLPIGVKKRTMWSQIPMLLHQRKLKGTPTKTICEFRQILRPNAFCYHLSELIQGIWVVVSSKLNLDCVLLTVCYLFCLHSLSLNSVYPVP